MSVSALSSKTPSKASLFPANTKGTLLRQTQNEGRQSSGVKFSGSVIDRGLRDQDEGRDSSDTHLPTSRRRGGSGEGNRRSFGAIPNLNF